jgi:putative PIN family toxin of toxin-antitoxin system
LRVVLDTNVLVSALIFPGGAPELVYRLALEDRIELVSSAALLAELGAVLESKFGWEPDRVEVAVAQVARIAIIVQPVDRISDITADPADNRILEVALTGGAAAIVSGDGHLLALGTWRDIPIQTPADFLSIPPRGVGR